MKFLVIIFRRLLYAVILMLAVIILNFMLIHLAPGNPADTLVGEMGGATEEVYQQIREDYGLDKSIPRQLFSQITKMARLDLGTSFSFDEPVTSLILERMPATLILILTSLMIAVILGTFLGVIAAQRPRGFFSHLVTLISLAGFSAPVFWTGLMLLVLFSYLIPIFPSFGMSDIGFEMTFFDRFWSVLHHLVLPAATLSSIYLALYSRLSRASMLDVLGSDYIRTARSKGLSRRVVVYKHALKNALLPVVTMAGLQFSGVVAGAVIVETVFSWPGLGQLAFEAIGRRDHPLLLGILFFSTLIVVIANILTDLSYRLLDPRIK